MEGSSRSSSITHGPVSSGCQMWANESDVKSVPDGASKPQNVGRSRSAGLISSRLRPPSPIGITICWFTVKDSTSARPPPDASESHGLNSGSKSTHGPMCSCHPLISSFTSNASAIGRVLQIGSNSP